MQLGQIMRDVVTGFEGTAVARVEYINGCVQFCLTPKSAGGVMPTSEYFDFQRLEVVGDGPSMPKREAGGVMRDQPPAQYRG